MKRANGTGSVYKLSGKRRKPWYAVKFLGNDADGNQIRVPLGTYATKRDAEDALAKDRLMPVGEYANATLSQVFELWQGTRAYTSLSKQTQDNYNAAYKKYMGSYYDVKFRDMRTAQFQDMVDLAEKSGKSRSTMEKIKALSGILSEYAYSQDIVNKTYYSGIRLPAAAKKQIATFSDMQIALLFKNDMLPLVDTILILIYTGMRISELLTLTKFSIDLDKRLIVGGCKTDAGKDRIIPIHPKIYPYIKFRYDTSENYLIEYDKPTGNKKKGTYAVIRVPYRYEYYCDEYYSVLYKLGIEKDLKNHVLTPHKARHTFFTRLSSRCTDKKAIALVGGHTDPNFTDKIYVHPDIERLRSAIDCL